MEASLIVLGILVLLVIYIIAKGLVIVQQSETMVIERLGRYLKTLSSGINLIIPFIDKPRPMTWRITAPASKGGTQVRFINTDRIDLRENVYDFARQKVQETCIFQIINRAGKSVGQKGYELETSKFLFLSSFCSASKNSLFNICKDIKSTQDGMLDFEFIDSNFTA